MLVLSLFFCTDDLSLQFGKEYIKLTSSDSLQDIEVVIKSSCMNYIRPKVSSRTEVTHQILPYLVKRKLFGLR